MGKWSSPQYKATYLIILLSYLQLLWRIPSGSTFAACCRALIRILSFCCCLVTQSCPTICDPVDACQASLAFTISWSLLKLVSIKSVMPSKHLILCHPLLLLPSIFPTIRVFSNELALRIRWLNYWSFSFSPSNEYSGLISFRIDWFDLLAVQETLRSLLQYHSSEASILWHSTFFHSFFSLFIFFFYSIEYRDQGKAETYAFPNVGGGINIHISIWISL